MSKFKVRFKVEKLELEIEGEKASVPEITNAVQKHVAGLLAAPAALAGGSTLNDGLEKTAEATDVSLTKKPRRRSQAARSQPGGDKSLVDLKHDPTKWGNPQQTWTTAEKSMWLLFVAKNGSEIQELSAPSITTTFNQHFRQSGAINRANVSRDLGKCKSKIPAWVGEDATKDPRTWYLTGEGEKIARNLVASATGAAAAAPNGAA
jgi:hypothetical protein